MRILLFATAVLAGASVLAYPLSSAARAPAQIVEPEEQGMASAAGVHVRVHADSWQGFPVALDEVIPLLVTIENRGNTPVRLRYQEFRLTPPAGAQRAALPPFQIRGTETAAVGTTGIVTAYPYTVDGFLVAPHLSPLFPTLTAFRGPFLFDPVFYTTYYPVFADIPLPTRDMVEKALPEGVLEPGGSISGYLYFQGDDVAGERATFQMGVVDAATGRALGTARVPLEID